MADNPELKVIITAEIEGLKKAVSETKTEIESLGSAQKEAAGGGAVLKEASDAVTDTLDKVKGVAGKAIKGTKALATSFKGAGTGAKAGAAGMKTFKAALISTGIGALVVILGELIANWDKIEAAVSPAGKALEEYNDELDRLSSLDKVFDSQLKAIRAQIKLRETLGQNADDLKETEKKILTAKLGELVAQRSIAFFALETTKAKALELSILDKIVAAALLAQTGSTAGFLPTITNEELKAIDDAQIGLNNLDGTIASISETIAVLNQDPIEPKVKNPFKGLTEGTVAYLETQKKLLETERSTQAISVTDWESYAKKIQDIKNQIYNVQFGGGLTRQLVEPIKTALAEIAPIAAELNATIRNSIPNKDQMTEKQLGLIESFQQLTTDLQNSVKGGLYDAISGIAASIGEALASGEDPMKAAGQALLGSMGKFMAQFGELLIAYGIANMTLFKAMTTGANPISAGAAIAAGVAMVAIGSAISSLSSKGAKTGGGVTGSTSSVGGSGRGSNYQSSMDASTYRRGDGQSFELKAQGTELVAVLNNSSRRQNALGGTQLKFG